MEELNALKSLYESVMHPLPDLFDNKKLTLRVYDGFDFCWCDCVGAINVDLATALKAWAKNTKNGKEKTCFAHIDYYAIFPAYTRMLYDSASCDD